MAEKQYIGYGLPYRDEKLLPGNLIVIEGSDFSGHSTQVKLLKDWLEENGHAVFDAGIKRSKLMKEAIDQAKEEQFLGHSTLALLYATDFAHEVENGIIPALRAGFQVVCDRYVYTLIARQLVRGQADDWLTKLFGFALKPDLSFYLSVPAEELMYRSFRKYGRLPYWESGMDLALSEDMFDSFLQYQTALLGHYATLVDRHGLIALDGTRPIKEIQADIRNQIKERLTFG